MYTDVEGFIIRQTKTLNGRRMIMLFSDKYGKISAGSSINEKGKSKSALAMRPFTYGYFHMFQSKENFNIKSADTIKSYYRISEDVDKFVNASYILELTEKILPDHVPAKKMLSLLISFFDLLETRKKSFETLSIAYIVKALQIGGVFPQLKKCINCGEPGKAVFFDIEEAGFICEKCRDLKDMQRDRKLLYKVNFDIVNILNFFMENPLERVKKLELDPEVLNGLKEILRGYMAYHMDIGKIKSEELFDI